MRPDESLDPANPVGKISRILLLLADPETRALLRQWLARDYHLEVPQPAVPELPAFDLAILDSPHPGHSAGGLGERKRFEQPAFLPVLLIASPNDPILQRPHLPEGVDEIILAPLNKFELRVRVANLLHTRRLSRALQGCREQPPDPAAACPGDPERTAEIQARMAAQFHQVAKLEALGTFAGGIAHEFNNVLGAMKGYLELACMTLDTVPGAGKISSKLKASLKAGDRARDLVKQILAFSRQKEREPGPLEIMSIVKESLKLLRASLPATVEIRQNLDPRCGLVLADPVQITQILMNLSSNAFEAMRETGGVLQIDLEPLRLEGGPVEPGVGLKSGPYLRLTVEDNGCGMDQKILERIFDPFFTTKPVGEGTGLGLSAVHGIVHSLGGAIGVSSEPGKGSAFRVYLPSQQSPSAAEVPMSGPIPRGTEHILLVDDEAAIVEIGTEFLQDLGYRVTAFTSGPSAWEGFQAQPQSFDLLITDLTMPLMTGLDLAESALKLRPDLLVLLTTGYSEANICAQAQEIGIRQCLLKPLVLRHLGWTVRRQLDRKA